MQKPANTTLPPLDAHTASPRCEPCFQLGRNSAGLWVIRDIMGRTAGVFTCRNTALRFARLEAAQEQVAIVLMNDYLEFDYAA